VLKALQLRRNRSDRRRIVLFLIGVKMILRRARATCSGYEAPKPFIVPLAIPGVAGFLAMRR